MTEHSPKDKTSGDSKPTHAGNGRKKRRLATCHGQRVAVLLVHSNRALVLRGVAVFERDGALGNILRVPIDDPLDGHGAEIIISADEWDGVVSSGKAYDCDYCFSLTDG